MKINAVRRLLAVTVDSRPYYGNQGLRVLGNLSFAYSQNPKRFKLLGRDASGLSFLSATVERKPFLVCMVGSGDDFDFVGSLRLIPTKVRVEGRSVKANVPQSFLRKEYRGKGIMLGMYQWALTQGSLISELEQTPDSHAVWQRLSKSHRVLTLRDSDAELSIVENGNWRAPDIRLFIKGQQ